MEYEELQIDREIIRDEILSLLKKTNFASYTQKLGFAARNINDLTGRGRELQAFLDEVYTQLETSGKIRKTLHTVDNSSLQRSESIYHRLYIQGLIFEEVIALAQQGIIMFARIEPDQIQWTGKYTFDPNHILVSEYGLKILADHHAMPYFADDYINLLGQIAPLDDELRGYLGEGLSCLHHSLPRAAILLLRLPCEHVLQQLINAIVTKLPDDAKKNSFKSKINKASTNLAHRANVIFDQLESDSALLANETHLKDRLKNELKPTFHTIREFAGNAAHRNVPIDRHQVRHFYGAFASTIYPVAMKIIQYLQIP
ncbi:MAG: hypothetical protein K8L91_15925 [Anaerolineae bacterium]|nr:hypothetical protein [Anaerolineae bacterium]